MRITKATLQVYIETEILIKQLEARKQEIREAILAHGGSEFEMGDFLVSKKEIARVIPIKVEEIREILGKKAEQILRETKSVRVEVKKVS